MADFWFALILAVFTLLIGAMIGNRGARDGIEKDCKVVHVIRFGDRAYQCIPQKVDHDQATR